MIHYNFQCKSMHHEFNSQMVDWFIRFKWIKPSDDLTIQSIK
jgi:hypothetical protein